MGCSQPKSANLTEGNHFDKPADQKNSESSTGLEDSIEKCKIVKVSNTPITDLGTVLKNKHCFSTDIVHVEIANKSIDNPYGKSIDHFYDGIYDGKILGSGIAGVVRECTHKKTGHKYAVKCLDLDKIPDGKVIEYLKSEILIMSELDHPSIVRLEEVYESPTEIYLVQQLCHGGELFDKLEEQDDYHYNEAECARLVKQMLRSVRYIHSKGIVHRDLKLENFLFSTKDASSELKLIDFGLSKHFSEGEVLSEAVGTPYTIAPETILGKYDERVDLWAIGVITYLLLSGETPFGGAGGEEPLIEVRDKILGGEYKFEPEYIWENVSDSAKNFIRGLLALNPNDRIASAELAEQHPWIIDWNQKSKEDCQSDTLLSPSVVKNLVKFKEYGDMKKLLCEVLSFTLLPDQIEDLKKEFEILDTNGSGEITMESLKKVLLASATDGSLGLSDEEVVDIFNAMRVTQSQTTIHWHEFIAASMNLCKVDDRNLKIAFERLDSDHKGYISLENVLNLMGYAEEDQREEMKRMYMDEMACGCESKEEGIEYSDFVLIMKGQRKSWKKNQPLGPSQYGFATTEDQYFSNHDKIFVDDKKTSLLEKNRNMYRSNRNLRIQVFEGSKRFESRRDRKSMLYDNKSLSQANLISTRLSNSEHSCSSKALQTNTGRRPRRSPRSRIQSDLTGMGILQNPNPSVSRRSLSDFAP